MRRKTICGILAAAVTAGALSSCGGGSYDSLLNKDAPVTVTVWHYYNGVQQTQFDEMVSEFNNTVGSEKGIHVLAYSKNSVSELADSVLASVKGEPGADKAPDIFAAYAETAYEIDKLGKLADMNRYFTADEKAGYVDEYIAEGVFGGADCLKIFPTAKSTEVFMLNVTDFGGFADAKDVTLLDLSTWEGLVKAAEKYYDYTDALTPDVPDDGKAFFGRDSVANYMNIGAKQLGKEFLSVNPDGSVSAVCDKAAVKKLWENFYVPYVKGYFSAESRFRSDDAKTGAIIALICSTTGAAYYPSAVTVNDDHTYPIENVVLNVPNFADTEPYVVQQGAGMSVIKSDDKTEYACAVFLKWFTGEERNIRFSVRSGYLPVKKSANDFDKIAADEASADISPTMMNTLKTAIGEINSYSLYTSPPSDNSAAVRDFTGSTMEKSAKDARAEVKERVSAGEDRDTVLAEFVSDAAFDKWYESFESGFYAAAGK